MKRRIEIGTDGIGFIELQDWMGNDWSITDAARTSFLGESKGDERDIRLIKRLLNDQHTSPFEMVELKFRVKMPLFVFAQWVRHRTQSYNSTSRRYTSEGIEFFLVDKWREQGDDAQNKQGGGNELDSRMQKIMRDMQIRFHQMCLGYYNGALEYKINREQARVFLPQTLYTTVVIKANLLNILKFIKLRAAKEAQYEIRVYAKAMIELVEPIVFHTMQHWKSMNPELLEN